MRKITLMLLLGILGVFLISCKRETSGNSWYDANKKIKVLCTTAMIEDLVKQIGGSHIDSITLIQGDLDPHSYELVKGDGQKFQFAQLIFYNGLGLEHGASLKYQLMNDPKAIALGNIIEKKDLIRVNGVTDPHIWMDASLFAKVCEPIAYHLGRLDPKHRSDFYKRAKETRERILNAHYDVKNILHTVPLKKRYLVTTHDAFRYFVRAYFAPDEEKIDGNWQDRMASPEGLAPEGQISPVDIERITTFTMTHQVKTVFAESNLSKNALRKVVDVSNQKGLNVQIAADALYGDVMYESYLNTLIYNAKVLKTFLSGEE